jgi:hypothetical protein
VYSNSVGLYATSSRHVENKIRLAGALKGLSFLLQDIKNKSIILEYLGSIPFILLPHLSHEDGNISALAFKILRLLLSERMKEPHEEEKREKKEQKKKEGKKREKQTKIFFDAKKPFFCRSSSSHTRDYLYKMSNLFLSLPQPSCYRLGFKDAEDPKSSVFTPGNFTAPFTQYSRSFPFAYRETSHLLRNRITVLFNPRDEHFGLYYPTPTIDFMKFVVFK